MNHRNYYFSYVESKSVKAKPSSTETSEKPPSVSSITATKKKSQQNFGKSGVKLTARLRDELTPWFSRIEYEFKHFSDVSQFMQQYR